jgi:opacity protein-like surface antigen
MNSIEHALVLLLTSGARSRPLTVHSRFAINGKREMKKCSIATLLLLSAALSFAQSPKPSIHIASSDLFIGYVVDVPNFGASPTPGNFQGYELAYTLNHGARWGLTVSGSQAIAHSLDQWQLTAGPRFNFLTGRFRPYGTVQFGVSNQDSDQLHPANFSRAKASAENAITFRLGAGADYQLTRRLYWRVGQWAAQPVPWARHSSSLFQSFSTGLGFQF